MTDDERKAYNRDLYQIRKKYGLCVKCGKRSAWAGRVLCAVCTERRTLSETTEVNRARRLKWRAKCLKESLCIDCGKPAVFNVRCESCIEKNKLRMKMYRLRKNINANMFDGAAKAWKGM